MEAIMQNRINELTAKVEDCKAIERNFIRTIEIRCKKVIEDTILEGTAAKFSRNLFVRDNYNGTCEVIFELGFFNEQAGRIDFGSDVWCHYENGKLKLNYGTMGSYSYDEVFQVMRVMLVAKIWRNIVEIEDALANAVANFKDIKDTQTVRFKCESEIDSIKKQIKMEQHKNIENSLNVRDCFIYDSKRLRKLFGAWLEAGTITVLKSIGEKKVKIESGNIIRMIDKAEFINDIIQNNCKKAD